MVRTGAAVRRGLDTGRGRSTLRDSSGRALRHLDLDAAFFWLIVAFLLTVVAFFSLRSRHVQLDAKQVAEYERRTQFLSNSTVYIVEVGQPEGLLSRIPATQWASVSIGIDFVAFVYDDLPLFLTEAWVELAEHALREQDAPHFERAQHGVGIALFPCGCIIPNEYFVRVPERLGGAECVLLPGFVLPHRDVHWLDIAEPSVSRCRRRAEVLEKRGARIHAVELQSIRKTIVGINAQIANATAVKMDLGAITSSKMQKEALPKAPVKAET